MGFSVPGIRLLQVTSSFRQTVWFCICYSSHHDTETVVKCRMKVKQVNNVSSGYLDTPQILSSALQRWMNNNEPLVIELTDSISKHLDTRISIESTMRGCATGCGNSDTVPLPSKSLPLPEQWSLENLPNRTAGNSLTSCVLVLLVINIFVFKMPSFGDLHVSWVTLVVVLTTLYVTVGVVYRLYFHPLSKFPGPRLAAATLWYEAYYDVIKQGQYTFKIKELHKQYGM